MVVRLLLGVLVVLLMLWIRNVVMRIYIVSEFVLCEVCRSCVVSRLMLRNVILYEFVVVLESSEFVVGIFVVMRVVVVIVVSMRFVSMLWMMVVMVGSWCLVGVVYISLVWLVFLLLCVCCIVRKVFMSVVSSVSYGSILKVRNVFLDVFEGRLWNIRMIGFVRVVVRMFCWLVIVV